MSWGHFYFGQKGTLSLWCNTAFVAYIYGSCHIYGSEQSKTGMASAVYLDGVDELRFDGLLLGVLI